MTDIRPFSSKKQYGGSDLSLLESNEPNNQSSTNAPSNSSSPTHDNNNNGGGGGSRHTKGPSMLPVIKENRLNEASYHSSILNSKLPANYSEIVCRDCQGHLMTVYHHCLEDQDKSIPSPHHVDEIADAKRKKPPPFFELLKDPVQIKNTHYKDFGEKSIYETRARIISKQVADLQKGAVQSMHEKMHVIMKERPGSSLGLQTDHTHKHHEESFAGSLYKHMLQLKNTEIEKLRARLLEKTESEKREVENVRKLRKALGKSMQYYIKAEEWQQQEASSLQTDIRTLKKEMSVIMACLIHAETEKKELRQVVGDKNSVINNKDGQIAELEKQLSEMRGKLHDSLKDYMRLNEKVSAMAKQVETGTDQAEQRNTVLQKNLETMTKEYQEAQSDLTKTKRKLADLETETEVLIAKVNDLSKAKITLMKENDQLSHDLYEAQLQAERLMNMEELNKSAVVNLQKQLVIDAEKYKKELEHKESAISDLTRLNENLQILKGEGEGVITKLESENARIKATLKEITLRKEHLEVQLKEAIDLRRREAQDRDRVIHELTEQVRIAQSDAKSHEERRDKAIYQLNDLQSGLDREMTQNRMLLVEIERLKRDYTELKTTSKMESDKLSEMKTALTNDKVSLTKHVYELRQELKDKKEENSNLQSEFKVYQTQTNEKIKNLQEDLSNLQKEHSDLNAKHLDLFNQNQSLISVHDALTNEYQQLLSRFEELQNALKRTRAEYSNLSLYKDNLIKEKADLLVKQEELESSITKNNAKFSEMQSSWTAKEKEFQTTSQAREALINTLSNRTNELKEDVRKLTGSNQQFKEVNQSLTEELNSLKATLTETQRLKVLLEEKLDELRKELQTEKKLRIDFERTQNRLDRKTEEQTEEQLRALMMREKRLISIDETMHKETQRLQEVTQIIFPENK